MSECAKTLFVLLSSPSQTTLHLPSLIHCSRYQISRQKISYIKYQISRQTKLYQFFSVMLESFLQNIKY